MNTKYTFDYWFDYIQRNGDVIIEENGNMFWRVDIDGNNFFAFYWKSNFSKYCLRSMAVCGANWDDGFLASWDKHDLENPENKIEFFRWIKPLAKPII